jgi:hypothetical protein
MKLLFIILINLVLVACGGVNNLKQPSLLIKVHNCSLYEQSESSSNIYIVLGDACKSDSYEVGISYGDNIQVVKLNLEKEFIVNISNKRYKLTLVKENSWRKIENLKSWSHRDGAGALLFNGKIYLLGGWNHKEVVNEVWVTDDLLNWTQLPNAPWQARHLAGWVVHNQKMYVIGGDLIADVWSSTDGRNWKLETSSAPFGERYAPIAQSVGEYIYLYGGQYWTPVWWCFNRPDCLPVGLNDVWRSKDGVLWESVIDNAPWTGRALVHGGLYFKDRFYLVGGGLKNAAGTWSETYVEFTDIWSSPDAISWIKESEGFNFPGRTHFSVLSTKKGCYVSDGSVGTQANVTNDLFHASDCINYKKIEVPSDLPARHASSLFEFNASIVLLGGPPGGGAGTAIWQYFPNLKVKK